MKLKGNTIKCKRKLYLVGGKTNENNEKSLLVWIPNWWFEKAHVSVNFSFTSKAMQSLSLSRSLYFYTETLNFYILSPFFPNPTPTSFKTVCIRNGNFTFPCKEREISFCKVIELGQEKLKVRIEQKKKSFKEQKLSSFFLYLPKQPPILMAYYNFSQQSEITSKGKHKKVSESPWHTCMLGGLKNIPQTPCCMETPYSTFTGKQIKRAKKPAVCFYSEGVYSRNENKLT